MVQVKTAAVALIFVAPSLALPLQHIEARSDELVTREPIPIWIGGSILKVASNSKTRKEPSIATPELSARDFGDVLDAVQNVSERDFEPTEALVARDPEAKFDFQRMLGGPFIQIGRPRYRRVYPKRIRPREDTSDFLDLSERDLEPTEELEAREIMATRRFRQMIQRFRKPRFRKPGKHGLLIREDASGAEVDDLLARDYNFDLLD